MENVTLGMSFLNEIHHTENSSSVMHGNSSTSAPEVSLGNEDALREYAFMEINPNAAMPYIAMVALALVVGTFGNVLIIGAYGISKQVRVVGNEFILNLAIADLFITAVADPMCILGVTHGHPFFEKRPILCELVACMCLSACFCAFFNLGLITLNRYIYICHNRFYPKMFSRKKILIMCFSTWILAFLVEMPNFFGFGGHGFDMKNLQCIWMRTATVGYTVIVGVFLIATPLILMTVAYLLIFVTIQRSKRRVFSHVAFGGPQAKKQELRETIKSARSLFVVVIAFLICWTPYVFVILIDLQDRLALHTHLYVTFLAHLHSSLNCTIYAVTNPNFRQGYAKFLRIIWYGKADDVSSSAPGTGNTNTGSASLDSTKTVKVITVEGSGNSAPEA